MKPTPQICPGATLLSRVVDYFLVVRSGLFALVLAFFAFAASTNAVQAAAGTLSKIANNGSVLPDSATLGSGATDWACTRDNTTGLLWEVKTADGGLRDMGKRYTNFDDPTKSQWPNGNYPSQAEIDAASNSIGFLKAVNAGTLCGHSDWRMPSVNELVGLVDKTYVPTINPTYFPNTPGSSFWSGSPSAGKSSRAMNVYFELGYYQDNYRFDRSAVRLVRGQSFGFFALTLGATGAGSGTLTSNSGGIDCASAAGVTFGTCSVNYSSGTAVTLTATPAGGSSFTGWSGACSGTESTCTVAMNAAKDVSAAFAAMPSSRYSKIANNGSVLPVSATLGSGATDWACTSDNTTGLIWEVKTADGGLRDMGKRYTNYDDPTKGQLSAGNHPSQAEIDAASNSIGFLKAVNAGTLCGQSDWRMPSVNELVGLVDKTYVPTINPTYFPNTPGSYFWSGSPNANVSYSAWSVFFYDGNAYDDIRRYDSLGAVRLVRGGQSFGSFALTISVTGIGSGTLTSNSGGINCASVAGTSSGTCSANYASGTAVTLTATPASGSSFTGWSGACSGTASTCTVTMDAAKSVSAGFTAAASNVLNIDTDTFVSISTSGDSTRQSKNFGNETRLETDGEQYTAWGTARTFLRFDHTKIPSSASQIKLRLYAYAGDTRSGYESKLQVLRLTSAWDETSVTWNSKPGFDATVYAEKTIQPDQVVGWHEWDITTLVKSWQKGDFQNQGLMLYSTSTGSNGGYRYFVSSDDSTRPNEHPYVTFTAAEIGLVGQWNFDSGNANLTSGTANNGVPTSSVSFGAGKDGQGAVFKGVDSPGHIRIPNSAALQFATEATYAVWARIDSTKSGNYGTSSGGAVLAKSHDRAGAAFMVSLTPGGDYAVGIQTYESWPAPMQTVWTPRKAIGEWAHLAITLSTTGGSKVYVDGKLHRTYPTPVSFTAMNGQDLYIGKFSDSWYPFYGTVDDLRIYNRVLSEAEIAQLAGNSGTTAPAPAPLGLSWCAPYRAPAQPDTRYVKVFLKRSGTTIAEARVSYYGDTAFCVDGLSWSTPGGAAITDWSSFFAGQATMNLEIVAQLADGSSLTLGTQTAQAAQFASSIDSDTAFPAPGPSTTATLTAKPAGGTPPYTYRWSRVSYAPDGTAGATALGTGSTLAFDGSTSARTLASGINVIRLQTTDSAGKVSFAQLIAAVDVVSGQGDGGTTGRLVRGVNLPNGNFHQRFVDLSVPGKGPNFVLSRAYNSGMTGRGPFGSPAAGWHFNLQQQLAFVPHSDREAMVRREDGSWQGFFREADAKWYAMTPGVFDELVEGADGRWTLYTPGNQLYRFAAPNSSGIARLEAIEDRHGQKLTLQYNSSGLLSGVSDAGGRSYAITLDASGRITRVADFSGRAVSYAWSDGQIASVTDVRGQITRYGYDSMGRMTDVTDPRGGHSVLTYDANGRAKTVADAVGNTVTYAYGTLQGKPATVVQMPIANNSFAVIYDKGGRITETVDASNYAAFAAGQAYSSTKREYLEATSAKRTAERGLVKKVVDRSNAATEMAFSDDGKGTPTRIVDALQQAASATYQTLATNLRTVDALSLPGTLQPFGFSDFAASGQSKTLTDPLGNRSSRVFDTSGLMTSATDARGNTRQYTYDSNGNLTQIRDAAGNVVTHAYDALGRRTSTTDARNAVTRFTYDSAGNLLTSIDALGGVTTYTYDANGNRIGETDPRGNSQTWVYDAANRVTGESYRAGGVNYTRTTAYDAMGRVSSVTNENGHATSTSYDPRGWVAQTANALAETTRYTYDAEGRVLTSTDPMGRVTTHEYDALGREIRVSDALGNASTTTWDARGNVASRTDARGKTTRYEYDDLGRMVKVTDAAGGQTTATYDATGNLLTVTDPRGNTVSMTWDALGRLTAQRDGNNRTWSMTYDANGNVLTRTTPDGKTTSWTYDLMNRVTQVSYPGGPAVSYGYDANGNRLWMQDAADASKRYDYQYDEANRLLATWRTNEHPVRYRWDGVGNLSRLIYRNDAYPVDYAYDAAERMASVTDWRGHVTRYTYDASGAITQIQYGNGARVEKQYDSAGRLVNLVNRTKNNDIVSSHAQTLDAVGNPLQSATTLPPLDLPPMPSVSMLYDAANRLSSVSGRPVTHDNDGRLTAYNDGASAIAYTYNAQDLILSVSRGGQVVDQYAYDGEGRRIARTVNGQTTRYVYDVTAGDMFRLLREYNENGDQAKERFYLYGADGLLAQIDGNFARHYYHFDPTGHTLALTDDNGAISDAYAYRPYGQTANQGSTPNPFRYVGKYGVMDDGNGLHWMRARYYNAGLGRFLSLDVEPGKVGAPGSLNRYGYARWNPLVQIDATGKDSVVLAGSNNTTLNTPPIEMKFNEEILLREVVSSTQSKVEKANALISKAEKNLEEFRKKHVIVYEATSKNCLEKCWMSKWDSAENEAKYIGAQKRVERVRDIRWALNGQLTKAKEGLSEYLSKKQEEMSKAEGASKNANQGGAVKQFAEKKVKEYLEPNGSYIYINDGKPDPVGFVKDVVVQTGRWIFEEINALSSQANAKFQISH